jgi:hypothetical protein
LTGGIGANFIEGFQAIDGKALGNTSFSGGVYGGVDNSDNSGTMRFCSLSFGGYILSANNEINGITYGGCGSGTTTEFCEIFNNADDDFEMFGGCNNLKYVAGIFGGDDGFDTDMGYRGQGQFMFQLQNNTKAGTDDTLRNSANIGDNLGENDGNEDPNYIKNASYPGTEFTYFNLTAIGIGYVTKGSSFPSDRSGPNFKDNSGGKILNSVYVEAPSGAIQDQATTLTVATYDGNGAGANRTAACLFAPTIANEPQGVIAYDTWSKCGGGKSSSPTVAYYTDKTQGGKLFPVASGRTSSGGSTINQPASRDKTVADGLSNLFVGTEVVTSTGTLGRLAGVNPILKDGVDELTNGTDPRASIAVATGLATGVQNGILVDRGDFFARNTFRGAFRNFNWLKNWTLADQLGVFAANTVSAPDVSLTRTGTGNVVVNFLGDTVVKYNIEVSSDNKTYTPFMTVSGGGLTPVSVTITGVIGTGRVFARVIPL